MKNRVFATFACLTLLTAATAFAQNIQVSWVKVPFEFRVGEAILPAGEYTVRPEAFNKVLSIQCSECKAGAMVMTCAVEGQKTQKPDTLVFNRYNETYFLSKVWPRGYSQGQFLPKTKTERELARNGSPAQHVVVALARP